jgi:tripartite-type tricarboxylate transporter receptor subunit TctC
MQSASTKTTCEHLIQAFVSLVILMLSIAQVSAQSYPSKPIRFLVPYAAGGGGDIVARTFAAYLSKELGQQWVVDNRAGGTGIIAMEYVAKAAPDGYTLVQTNISTSAFVPFTHDHPPYDAVNDFAPISITTLNPTVMVVNAKLGVRSLKEFIDLAKAKPGKLLYGSTGPGSIFHLAGYILGKEARIDLVHVGYKGLAPATTDLLAGQIHFIMCGLGTANPHIRSGALTPLALSDTKRTPAYPDVPTFKELGLENVLIFNWNGILAPAKTPDAVVRRLNAAIRKAGQSDEVVGFLAKVATAVETNTPEEFDRFIKKEQQRYGPLLKELRAVTQ